MPDSPAGSATVDQHSMLPVPVASPSDFAARNRRGQPKRVVVIGAGMAGLVAAYELSNLGHQVKVLEKAARVGGRVRTHQFAYDGVESHAEAGAMRLPANHSATLHYVREFGLPTRRFVNFNWETFYRILRRQALIKDWPAASPYNPPDYWRNPHPAARFKAELTKLLAKVPYPLNLARTADLGGVQELVELSEVSLRYALLRAGVSHESLEEMGHATGMKAYMHYSALEILAEFQSGFDVNMVELVDGMEALPTQLALRLGDRVRLQSPATAVVLSADGATATVHWEDSAQGPQTTTCDYVVCAIPAPDVTRSVRFEPGLPGPQINALQTLTYAPAAKTLVHMRQRFWERQAVAEVRPVFGGITFTDEPVSQFVYPSDNALPVPEDDPSYQAAQVVSTSRDRAIGVETGYYTAKNPGVSGGPGILVAYRWGNDARLYNHAMSNRQREDLTRDAVEHIHGVRASTYIEGYEHVCWPEAFAHFMPGEHLQCQPQLERPYPSSDNPRVYWAGEHVGYLHGWIHSAVVTAWNAVDAIARAPARP